MSKHQNSSGKVLWLSILPWAWHPILGLIVLFLPEAVIQPLVSPLQSTNVHLALPAISVLASKSAHPADVFSYLSINWLLLPMLALIFLYLTRHKTPLIKSNMHALMLIAGALFVGGLTFLFFAVKFPTSTVDAPMSRGFFILRLLESSRIGLWIVTSAATWLCALSATAFLKSIHWIFQRSKGIKP